MEVTNVTSPPFEPLKKYDVMVSPPSKPSKYDVFLSFGPDTHKGFVSLLYAALGNIGLRVFKDDEELTAEQAITTKRMKAIEESMTYVVVFSKAYAKSRWCLEELSMIMDRRMEMYGHRIFPLFYDVYPFDVRDQKDSIGEAFEEHEKKSWAKAESILSWRAALTEAAMLSGMICGDRYESEEVKRIADHITELVEAVKLHPSVEHKAYAKSDVKESFLIKSNVKKLVNPALDVAKFPVGIKSRVQDLVSHLDLDNGSADVRVVGVFGKRGIGKTEVANAFHNEYCKDFVATIHVNLRESRNAYIDDQITSEGRTLVIIDHIDEKEQLGELDKYRKVFTSGSRIVLITREESLLKQLEVDDTFSPQPITEEEAVELFSWYAFGKQYPDEDYLELSKDVVSVYRSLPPALTFIGDYLFGKSITECQKIWKAQILQRLYLYCSIFPVGYEFDEDELVQLWIAEGFIEKNMEVDGISYFKTLINEGYLVYSRDDSDSVYSFCCTPKKLYKLSSDNVDPNSRGLAEELKAIEIEAGISKIAVSCEDYFRAVGSKLDGASATTRHLSLVSKHIDDKSFGFVQDMKELRTLLLLSGGSGSSITHVPHSLFWSLKFLRTLKLRGTLISELPSSIRYAKELRYLDVSYTPITQLPESVVSLQHLQTLKLRGCEHFQQLPENLKKLIKLRHIELDILQQLDVMPAGMGHLTDLQTLSAFLAGHKKDGSDIGELKYLNNLKGALCISRLENVSEVQEARDASLIDKKHLQRLELRWSYPLKSDQIAAKQQLQEEIIECLQPHSGLEELQIQCYSGSKLPTWIRNPSSVGHLVDLTLYRCNNVTLLPSIGRLPLLQILSILEMNGVKEINHQFFRNDLVDDHQSSPAFPKLEKLDFDTMHSLTKWVEIQEGDFPSLVELTVNSCQELVTMPSVSSLKNLKHLELKRCPKLLSGDGWLPKSLESLMIIDCPEIKRDDKEWSKYHCLRSIWFDYEEVSRKDTLQVWSGK